MIPYNHYDLHMSCGFFAIPAPAEPAGSDPQTALPCPPWNWQCPAATAASSTSEGTALVWSGVQLEIW